MSKQPCQQLMKVFVALCDDLATPLAQELKTLALNGEWVTLQKRRVDPRDYKDSEVYFRDTLVVDFFRKAEIDSDLDLEAAAVASFSACEAENLRTNGRLHRYRPGHSFSEGPLDDFIQDFISEWRKDIGVVLSAAPAQLSPRFGPGSTFSNKGKLTTIPDKMTGNPCVTAAALELLRPHFECTWWYWALLDENPGENGYNLVSGNRFTSVPKDATKNRGICIEPSLNLSFQLDVGRILKGKLHKIGLDLLHDQQRHRELARQASQDGLLATVDLSNASDTICRNLIHCLVRDDWWVLLNSLRSKKTYVGGKWVWLEKFSSMGNGFTFELETLVFATLARLVVRRGGGDPDSVSCYGDDIILPTVHVSDLKKALAFFGFTPNASKTFEDGPFRESCGGDFFNGQPVRAHFIGELPNEPQQWITLANGLRRAAYQSSFVRSRWAYIQRAWLRCLDALPGDVRRLRGPVHLGDIVIHDDQSRWCIGERPPSHKEGSLRFIRAYTPVVPLLDLMVHWKPSVHLASALYGIDSSGVAPRGGTTGYRITKVPFYGVSWLPGPEFADSSDVSFRLTFPRVLKY